MNVVSLPTAATGDDALQALLCRARTAGMAAAKRQGGKLLASLPHGYCLIQVGRRTWWERWDQPIRAGSA